ncbi:hypothetical protein O181_088418 [Austropuccinia psidii MF-1]|uniref:Uncharacterized protein n=1 Tax=Austropuccinia psidii MF-1 TaxID=1389203 RepID=A0A9Q3P2T9_9BASI|nr:hypothetical protein [Austropuccinia psidii MF-1]
MKSFLGQEKTIALLGGWSPFFCKDKIKNIQNWLNNQILLSIDQKKELEMNPSLEKEGPVASTSSKLAPEVSKDKPKGPQKKQKGIKNNQGKGKGKANWHRPYPPGYRSLCHEECIQYGQNSYGIHIQGAGKDEQDLSMQIIDEIKFIKSIIDVELCKFDAKFNKLTSDINDLKKERQKI